MAAPSGECDLIQTTNGTGPDRQRRDTDHASPRGPGRCPAASAHPAGVRRPFPAQGVRGWR